MKRFKQSIVISVLLIFLSIAVYLILMTVNNKNKIRNLNSRLAYAEMVEIMDEYFLVHGTYPHKISDLWFHADPNDKKFIKSAFLDPFSVNNSKYLLYCPQYSVNNDFIKGFFLVSRGYDKHLNINCNEIGSDQNLYVLNKHFYNSININNNDYNPFAPIREKPQILSDFFGHKDILVLFWDKNTFRKKEYFQLKKDGKLTMNHTLNKILKYGYRKVKKTTQNPQTVSQEIFLPIDSIAFKIDNNKLNFNYKGYKFICTFYPDTKINEEHFKVITGILTGLDKSNKQIFVNYCTFLTNDDLNK